MTIKPIKDFLLLKSIKNEDLSFVIENMNEQILEGLVRERLEKMAKPVYHTTGEHVISASYMHPDEHHAAHEALSHAVSNYNDNMAIALEHHKKHKDNPAEAEMQAEAPLSEAMKSAKTINTMLSSAGKKGATSEAQKIGQNFTGGKLNIEGKHFNIPGSKNTAIAEYQKRIQENNGILPGTGLKVNNRPIEYKAAKDKDKKVHLYEPHSYYKSNPIYKIGTPGYDKSKFLNEHNYWVKEGRNKILEEIKYPEKEYKAPEENYLERYSAEKDPETHSVFSKYKPEELKRVQKLATEGAKRSKTTDVGETDPLVAKYAGLTEAHKQHIDPYQQKEKQLLQSPEYLKASPQEKRKMYSDFQNKHIDEISANPETGLGSFLDRINKESKGIEEQRKEFLSTPEGTELGSAAGKKEVAASKRGDETEGSSGEGAFLSTGTDEKGSKYERFLKHVNEGEKRYKEMPKELQDFIDKQHPQKEVSPESPEGQLSAEAVHIKDPSELIGKSHHLFDLDFGEQTSHQEAIKKIQDALIDSAKELKMDPSNINKQDINDVYTMYRDTVDSDPEIDNMDLEDAENRKQDIFDAVVENHYKNSTELPPEANQKKREIIQKRAEAKKSPQEDKLVNKIFSDLAGSKEAPGPLYKQISKDQGRIEGLANKYGLHPNEVEAIQYQALWQTLRDHDARKISNTKGSNTLASSYQRIFNGLVNNHKQSAFRQFAGRDKQNRISTINKAYEAHKSGMNPQEVINHIVKKKEGGSK